ncbi:hypothetical protein ACUOFC_58040, partial [Escherichia sp. TWPC-MK]
MLLFNNHLPSILKLISVHNADLNVVLTTPASRCLSLL